MEVVEPSEGMMVRIEGFLERTPSCRYALDQDIAVKAGRCDSVRGREFPDAGQPGWPSEDQLLCVNEYAAGRIVVPVNGRDSAHRNQADLSRACQEGFNTRAKSGLRS